MSSKDRGLRSRRQQRQNYCFLNQPGKYLFINIPKNASTSIRTSIILDEYKPYDSLEKPDL